MKMARRVLIPVIASLLLSACEQTPTGRRQLALVPDGTMAEMGEESFAQIKAQLPQAADAQARQLVQCIAEDVVDAARRVYPGVRMPERWEVVTFADPTPNAFALPGGHIGIHTGMLELAGTPAQLAAVVAHEVGHVLADHGNERLTQQLGVRAVLFVVRLFGEGGVEESVLYGVLGIGAQLGVTLPFSRAHESEADRMGLEIMAAAGFDPRQSVALWRAMADAGGEQPPAFMSTHPSHEGRIETLQAHMEDAVERFASAEPAACGVGGSRLSSFGG